MSAIKEQMSATIQAQPEDASYEEILRELAFGQMIARGLEDVENGRTVPHEEVLLRIREWQR